MRLCASFASVFTCSMIARSVAVPSSVSRIVSYMVVPFLASSAGNNVPCGAERFRQAVNVHRGDQNSTAPTSNQQEPAEFPVPHAPSRTGEMQKRKHGEGEL